MNSTFLIDWTKPATEILTELLSVVWVPTNTDVTIGTIRDTLGFTPEQYGLVRGTLERAINTLIADNDPVNRMKGIDLKDARDAMLSRGISLSDANRQATIDELAAYGSWPDAVRDAVKALGGVWVADWVRRGFASEPDVSFVEFLQSRELAIESTATRINAAKEARRAAIDDFAKTGAEIIAATEEAFG